MCNHYGALLLHEYFSIISKRNWACFWNCWLYCWSFCFRIFRGICLGNRWKMAGNSDGFIGASNYADNQSYYGGSFTTWIFNPQKKMSPGFQIIESLLVFWDGSWCNRICLMPTNQINWYQIYTLLCISNRYDHNNHRLNIPQKLYELLRDEE